MRYEMSCVVDKSRLAMDGERARDREERLRLMSEQSIRGKANESRPSKSGSLVLARPRVSSVRQLIGRSCARLVIDGAHNDHRQQLARIFRVALALPLTRLGLPSRDRWTLGFVGGTVR